jgi:hypothetical protein
MQHSSGPCQSHGSGPVEIVLERLERVRRSGRGWTARCPSHEDKSPSLSIHEGRDGRALLCCHAGCSTLEITRALGLEMRELFERDGDWVPRSPRPLPKPVVLPRSVAEILVESSRFARHLEAAKLLARLEPDLLRQDVLTSWDYLTEHFELPALLRLAYLVRGVATLRFCDSKNVENPEAVARAVHRLCEEVDRGRSRTA